MKRIFPLVLLLQSLSAQAASSPRLAMDGNLYRGDELVSSFSLGNVTAVATPVQIEDTVEHGYVDRATFKNGEISFLPASVASGLTLKVIANLTPENAVFIRVKGEVAELNGFSIKATPGTTATVQEPRMHRNGFTSAVVASRGESKNMLFGNCAPKVKGQDLCTYKLVISVRNINF